MNLFDNAKFSDKFLTRDNRIALYLYDSRHCTQSSRGGHRLYLDSKDVNGKGCNGLYGEISCDDEMNFSFVGVLHMSVSDYNLMTTVNVDTKRGE